MPDAAEATDMIDDAEERGQLIRHLEDAPALSDEIQDGRLVLRR
jgi:hypothetical protein